MGVGEHQRGPAREFSEDDLATRYLIGVLQVFAPKDRPVHDLHRVVLIVCRKFERCSSNRIRAGVQNLNLDRDVSVLALGRTPVRSGLPGRLETDGASHRLKVGSSAWLSARRVEIGMQVWAPEVAAHGTASRTVPTLQAYADVWLETRKTKGRGLRPTTRAQYRMLLNQSIYPTFGEERIDKISNEDVNDWYEALAPGRETIKAQSYSLLRTIFASAASERPHPPIPYNPAHIRGADKTKRVHRVEPRRSRSFG